MTAGEVAFSIFLWGLLLTVVGRYAMWEVRQYRASKRKRYKELLGEIADLERELGLNTDDPAYRSV